MQMNRVKKKKFFLTVFDTVCGLRAVTLGIPAVACGPAWVRYTRCGMQPLWGGTLSDRSDKSDKSDRFGVPL